MTHDPTPLTRTVKGGGCAAKLPPADLDRALCGLDLPVDDNLLVGLERADDAGVYRISEELAIVQTVDFFPPMVDDPFDFGRIAAANALSDVYAMGGVPKTAMNLVMFPSKRMDMGVLRQVLEGGLAVMREAGVVLVGGHSIDDPELKYGLSVTGFIHPDRILVKRQIVPHDLLILTKPLGSGIVTTALRGGMVDDATARLVVDTMATLNKRGAEILRPLPVHACTDVTGFGFLGHLAEMVAGSGKSVQITASSIPCFPGVLEWGAMGLLPAGLHANRAFRGGMVDMDESIPLPLQDLLFDPQTSGGLLAAIPPDVADEAICRLHEAGVAAASVVGIVTGDPNERIRVTL